MSDYLQSLFLNEDNESLRSVLLQIIEGIRNEMDIGKSNMDRIRDIVQTPNLDRDHAHYMIMVCMLGVHSFCEHVKRACPSERILPFLNRLNDEHSVFLEGKRGPTQPCVDNELPKYPDVNYFVWAMRMIYFSHWDPHGVFAASVQQQQQQQQQRTQQTETATAAATSVQQPTKRGQ
jgi:hypothetical protein